VSKANDFTKIQGLAGGHLLRPWESPLGCECIRYGCRHRPNIYRTENDFTKMQSPAPHTHITKPPHRAAVLFRVVRRSTPTIGIQWRAIPSPGGRVCGRAMLAPTWLSLWESCQPYRLTERVMAFALSAQCAHWAPLPEGEARMRYRNA